MSPGYGCNVAIEVKGPLATSGRVNVAHGRAERAGAVTPTILRSSKRMRWRKGLNLGSDESSQMEVAGTANALIGKRRVT